MIRKWPVEVRTANGGTKIRYVEAPGPEAAKIHVQMTLLRGESFVRVLSM